METGKVLVLVLFFMAPIGVSAYSPETTHAGITREIVSIYNKRNSENTLSLREIEFVVHGSVAEDDGLRFLRHFYDPVNNQGLTFLSFLNGGESWPSAKTWAQTPSLQDPNKTWQYALTQYREGDREGAFLALGHILHLIEDMTVPDHARDDPHPPYLDGSPYENLTRKYSSVSLENEWNKDEPQVSAHDHLDFYFEEVAKFSNQNFFSKDTAQEDGRYKAPRVAYVTSEAEKEYFYAYGRIAGQSFRLARAFQFLDFEKARIVYRYVLDDPDNLVMEDYWQILSRKAIEAGVGVMELFFREAEKVDEAPVVRSDSENSFFIDHHFYSALIPASGSIRVRDDSFEDKRRPLSPFSDIAGIGFAIPVAEALHVRPHDVETGVLHSAPLQGVTSDSAFPSAGEESEHPVSGAPVGETVAPLPAVDESSSEPSSPSSPSLVRTPTILGSGYVGPRMVLTKEGSPYHITRSMIVPHHEVLRIEPGVIVKIASDIYVDLNGTLDARGTTEEPIVITSIYDDDHAGDTNGDGICVDGVEVGGTWCPVQREWRRFGLYGTTTLEHVIMRYGGSSPGSGVPDSFRAMINIGSHPEVVMRDSVIEKTPQIGIYADGSRAIMERLVIRDCARLHTRFAGAVLDRGAPVFRDSAVERCGVGVRLEASEGAVVTGNQFLSNANIPIQHSQAGAVTMFGNSGSGNRWNGIAFPTVAFGQTVTLEKNPLPFIMPPAFWTPIRGILLVSPGVTLKIGTTPMRVQGALELVGSEQDPVIVTSIEDDSDGNDAAGDGVSSNQPRVGIQRFGAQATTTFIYTEFRAGITVSGP